MTEFPELLNKFIEQKNIHIYSMAKYCGLDRSTLYKIIKGNRRPPSASVRDKMACFMHLTPDETRQFEQAWEISFTGKLTYCRRKSIEDFLLNFSDGFSDMPVKKSYFSKELPADSPCIAFSEKDSFPAYLHAMLKKESHSTGGRMGFLIQPDYRFLFHLLSGPEFFNSTVRIDHIFCLDQTEQLSETDEYCHINYLKQLLLPFKNGLDYHPYCFYDNIRTHFSNLNLFPVLILTEGSALVSTSDCTRGILYQDPATVKMMWKLFDTYQKSCIPVLRQSQKSFDKLPWECTPSYFAADKSFPCFFTKPALESLGRLDSPKAEALKQYIPADFRFLKGALAEASGSLHLYAENNVLYLIFDDIRNTPVRLSLHEPGLLSAFEDYLTHIPAKFCQDSFSKC